MTPELFKNKLLKLRNKVSKLQKISNDLDEFKRSFKGLIYRNEINTKNIINEFLRIKKTEIANLAEGFAQRQAEAEKQLLEERTKIYQAKEFLKAQKERDRQALERIANEKTLGFPWLATAFGDYISLRDEQIADFLENKKPPAPKAADVVRKIKAEKRELEKRWRMAKYFVDYYEKLFPWLIDFIGDDLDEIVRQHIDGQESAIDDVQFDPVRKWLTDAEYEMLSTIEKNQLALDRYWEKKKSNWEVGRDYERYIGYLYEKEGYQVEYQGIVKGFEDLGRDLICKKDGIVEIVQCKCWSKNKIIREKHINQLFGTTVMFLVNNCDRQADQIELFPELLRSQGIVPTFITSTQLSDTAGQFAEILGVKVKEGISLSKYPLVKCNISRKSGEKIYHLPFDQQYDKTIIEKEKNECYVETVAEAESLGFRRAFRWRGQSEDK